MAELASKYRDRSVSRRVCQAFLIDFMGPNSGFFNTGTPKKLKLKEKTQGKNSTSRRIFPPIRKIQEKNPTLGEQFLPAPKTQENNLKFEKL